MTTMGEILKIFRLLQEEELTTTKLSQLTGYSQPHISRIENNTKKPTDEFLEKISEVYNVPIKEFYRILHIANEKGYDRPRLCLEVVETYLKYNKEGD